MLFKAIADWQLLFRSTSFLFYGTGYQRRRLNAALDRPLPSHSSQLALVQAVGSGCICMYANSDSESLGYFLKASPSDHAKSVHM